MLEHLPSLVSLDLGLNILSSLGINVFIGNRKLEILTLDHNKVIIRVCRPFSFFLSLNLRRKPICNSGYF